MLICSSDRTAKRAALEQGGSHVKNNHRPPTGGFLTFGELMNDISEIKKRLGEGDRRFTDVAGALADLKAHLQRQDSAMACLESKVDKVSQGTEDIVAMWSGGVKAARFFCRAADAWRFVMREVVRPFALPVAGVYGIWYVHEYGHVPVWLIAALKFVERAL